MNGRNLTLGIIAGLAVAGLARRASGSGNTPGGRFRKISPTPTGFVTSPLSFVRGTTLELAVDPEETGRAQPGTGLYHVTTNLPAVLAVGRLRSRRELRAAGRQGAGLGGGILDQAPDRVSVGLTLDGALRVLRGTRMMARAVHGQISAAEALEAMKTFSSSSTDMLDRAAEWMLDQEDTDDPAYLDAKSYEDDLVRAGREVLASPPGPDLYSALKRWEMVVAEAEAAWIEAGHISDDERTCGTTIGFTEPAHRFERIRPENVGLLRLAGRKEVWPDPIPSECELRFRPEDLTLVGVWEGT